MSDRDSRPPTFADACEAVLEAPTEDHSVDTTLAPIHERTLPDGWAERREHLVTSRFPADVDRVLERSVATTTAEGLTGALQTAGFESVLVAGESDLPGVVVGVGVRPVETGDCG